MHRDYAIVKRIISCVLDENAREHSQQFIYLVNFKRCLCQKNMFISNHSPEIPWSVQLINKADNNRSAFHAGNICKHYDD